MTDALIFLKISIHQFLYHPIYPVLDLFAMVVSKHFFSLIYFGDWPFSSILSILLKEAATHVLFIKINH